MCVCPQHQQPQVCLRETWTQCAKLHVYDNNNNNSNRYGFAATAAAVKFTCRLPLCLRALTFMCVQFDCLIGVASEHKHTR